MTTPTTDRRPRRPGRLAAVGAVALTAAVALPAYAMDRVDDTSIAAVTDVNRFDPAEAINDRRAVAAYHKAEAARQAELDAAIVAAIGALPPEQQFEIKWAAMDDAERTATINWFAEVEAAERAAAEQAAAEQAEAARRAEQARQAQQARQSAPRSASAPRVSGGSVWDTIAQCESSGNWAMNSGNGFYGGLQFTMQSWQYVGGTQYAAMPHQASREQQIAAAERLLARQGWGAWPACSSRAGLR
jgi:resuscitation-promoting factor RpfB